MQQTRWLTQRDARSSATRAAEFAGLQTPAARLTAFGAVTAVLYLLPYDQLLKAPNISIWSRLRVPAWSIGLTRAYSRLLHGEIRAAYEMNPLIFPVVGVVAAIAVADIRTLLTSRKSPGRRETDSEAVA